MGFFDVLGKAASAGSAKLKEMNDETKRLYEEYQTKTDQQLMRLAQTGSFSSRAAASRVLKERGYGRG